ncbi:MAG: rod shape-determining protein MreC [Xylophilus ampelinus]
MPLLSIDHHAPPLFKQGQSALSKLAVFSALALFLMVADARFGIVPPLRAAISVALYPLQRAVREPVEWLGHAREYVGTLQDAQAREAEARRTMAQQSQRANQVEELLLENARLRRLLELRERLQVPQRAAEVLYDAPDAFALRVVIDKGSVQGIAAGAPVIDGTGVLGQVTRVYPFVSEVALLVDREVSIPVVNTRTGVRSVVYGDPSTAAQGYGMEMRFVQGNADVQAGDVLATSGIDGVYPPGLPVARVAQVERRSESTFARIHCAPLATVRGARHVMVLDPAAAQLPPRPEPEPEAPVRRRAGRPAS